MAQKASCLPIHPTGFPAIPSIVTKRRTIITCRHFPASVWALKPMSVHTQRGRGVLAEDIGSTKGRCLHHGG
jgi:hypothetical protein